MVPRINMNDSNGTGTARHNGGAALNGDTDVSIPSTSSASLADSSYIIRVGEGIGIESMSVSAVAAASSNVMYVLREVISSSVKYAEHSRRGRLLEEDVDAAMQAHKRPAQFGFKPQSLVPLRLAGSGGRQLFFEEDREVELAPIYTAAPPKIPAHATLRAHWLAIDGEQPAVPENPIPSRTDPTHNDVIGGTSDENQQEDASRLLSLIKGTKRSEQVALKTTTTHALSLEQQVFFKEITEAVMGNDDLKRTEALHLLKTDAGLQPLIGRFSVAVTEGVKCNIVQHNLAFLIYLMRMVQSLVHNHNLSLDKCLHEFLPSILSCVLSRQVCSRPEADNHWALREFASRLIAELCRKYQVLDVQSRITRVLTRVWSDTTVSIATLYGSLFALNELGLETLRAVVVPRTPHLFDRLRLALSDRNNPADRIAAERLSSFVSKVLVNFVRKQRPSNLREYNDYVDMFGGFAEAVFRVVATEVLPTSRGGMTATPQRVQLAPIPLAQSTPMAGHLNSPVMNQRMIPRGAAGGGGNYTPTQTHRVMTPQQSQQRHMAGSTAPQTQYRFTSSNPSAVVTTVRRTMPAQQRPPSGAP